MTAETRLACRRCMAVKGIFCTVSVLAWTDQNVCLRHQLWTGHGVARIGDQTDMADIPEISRARVRHRCLAGSYGLQRVRGCYETAESTIDWSSREPSSPAARQQERVRRVMACSDAGVSPAPTTTRPYSPELVGLLSVLASQDHLDSIATPRRLSASAMAAVARSAARSGLPRMCRVTATAGRCWCLR